MFLAAVEGGDTNRDGKEKEPWTNPFSRKVLLSTSWLSSVAPNKNALVVNMDKKRIQEAPPYDPDVAILREYETRLHDYYGYPYYWQ